MSLGKGKTEHAGPRDMSRKDGHWGYTEEAKDWASRARRRDERIQLRREQEAAEGRWPISTNPSDAVDALRWAAQARVTCAAGLRA